MAVLDRAKIVEWMDTAMVDANSGYRECEHNVGWADHYKGKMDVIEAFMRSLWQDAFVVEEDEN